VNGAYGEGAPGSVWNRWEGIFYNRSRTALTDISDGTSTTLLFGEHIGAMSSGKRISAGTWVGYGATGTGQGLRGPSNAGSTMFASRHPAVVQFCFADGSVKGLRRDGTFWPISAFIAQGLSLPEYPLPAPGSPWYVLQQLAGRRDGSRLDESPVLP
jgi:Protein of unknown function (DUF1559)